MTLAVDLDAESRLWPMEIDFDGPPANPQAHVDEWFRQAGCTYEREERVFEPAPRSGAAGGVCQQRGLEHGEIVSAVGAADGGTGASEVKPAVERCLMDHVGELLHGELVTEVDERALDGGDRDALDAGDVAWIKAPAMMDPDVGS
jgi:hypothetical protein